MTTTRSAPTAPDVPPSGRPGPATPAPTPSPLLTATRSTWPGAAPAGTPSTARLVTLLALRLVAFAAAQAVVVGLLAAAGTAAPLTASAAWWPLTASAANLLTLAVLRRALRAEGRRLRDLYRPDRARLRADLPAVLLVTVVGGPAAGAGTTGLATALWGDPQTALDLLVRPLPLAAAVVAVALFPVATALAELPLYYGYVQPRLADAPSPGPAAGGRPAGGSSAGGSSAGRHSAVTRSAGALLVVAVPALAHALQHVTLPVLQDARFLLWRALMFVPFALVVSTALRRRPGLLPYLVVVHLLLDLQMALLVLGAAR